MAYVTDQVIGVELNTPTPPYFGTGLTTAVGTFGPEGARYRANNGRSYVYGQASTAIPVGTTTVGTTYATPGANGATSVSFAATGGTGSYAIDLPANAPSQAAAINDFIYVGGAQGVN